MMIKNYLLSGVVLLGLGAVGTARADDDVVNPEKYHTPVDGRIKATSPQGQEQTLQTADVQNPTKESTPVDGRLKATSPMGNENQMEVADVTNPTMEKTPVDPRIAATSPKGMENDYASNDTDTGRRYSYNETKVSTSDRTVSMNSEQTVPEDKSGY